MFYWIYGLTALFFLLVMVLYNNLISKKNRVEYAYGSIVANLRKRRDLIPNLVEVVKRHIGHEQQLLDRLLENRPEEGTTFKSSPASQQALTKTETQLSLDLKELRMALAGRPELATQRNFLHMQAALNEVEEQLSASRRTFNAAVYDYNNLVEMFPTNLIARLMQYETYMPLELNKGEYLKDNFEA